MKEKIYELVEHIKDTFPNGCVGVSCEECSLHNIDGAVEVAVCELLSQFAYDIECVPHRNEEVNYDDKK